MPRAPKTQALQFLVLFRHAVALSLWQMSTVLLKLITNLSKADLTSSRSSIEKPKSAGATSGHIVLLCLALQKAPAAGCSGRQVVEHNTNFRNQSCIQTNQRRSEKLHERAEEKKKKKKGKEETQLPKLKTNWYGMRNTDRNTDDYHWWPNNWKRENTMTK